MQPGVLAKIGGLVALISITFLPVAGCGMAEVSGLQIMQANDVGMVIKALLAISIGCAFAAFFSTAATMSYATGAGGILSLLVNYAIARNKIPLDLKIGAIMALIGFAVIIVDGLLRQQSKTQPP